MFCSQAYGAGNLPLVGVWLQIYLVFTTVAGVPFSFTSALSSLHLPKKRPVTLLRTPKQLLKAFHAAPLFH